MVDALGQGDGQVKVLAGKIALQEAVQVSVPLLALALQALTVDRHALGVRLDGTDDPRAKPRDMRKQPLMRRLT